MLNNTVYEEGKVKQRPSGQENRTIIVGFEMIEKIKDEVSKTFEMEAKGKLAREVNPKDYIRIKAYNNDLTKNQTSKDTDRGE